MISIITTNYNTYDFLELLLESIERFSQLPVETIIIDNSTQQKTISKPHVHQFLMPSNVGHGQGLNIGVAKACSMFPNSPFIMFLDVDCHFLGFHWESKFLSKMKSLAVIGGKGPPQKPIRPACMFMHQKIARTSDWRDTPGYKGHRVTPNGYDVAIKAYYKLLKDNVPIGFMTSESNRYGTINGEEWCLDGHPIVYHHWHASHLEYRQKTDYPDKDLLADKTNMFNQISWRIP